MILKNRVSFLHQQSGNIVNTNTYLYDNFVMEQIQKQQTTRQFEQRTSYFNKTNESIQKKSYHQAIEIIKQGYIKTYYHNNKKYIDSSKFILKVLSDNIIQDLMILTLYKQPQPKIHDLRRQLQQQYQQVAQQGMQNNSFLKIVHVLQKLYLIQAYLSKQKLDQIQNSIKIDLKNRFSYVRDSCEKKKRNKSPNLIQSKQTHNSYLNLKHLTLSQDSTNKQLGEIKQNCHQKSFIYKSNLSFLNNQEQKVIISPLI